MEENPKEYGIFSACYTYLNIKSTYSHFLMLTFLSAFPLKQTTQFLLEVLDFLIIIWYNYYGS